MVKCTTKARMYRLGGSRMKGKGKGKGTGKGNLKLWSPPGPQVVAAKLGAAITSHHFPINQLDRRSLQPCRSPLRPQVIRCLARSVLVQLQVVVLARVWELPVVLARPLCLSLREIKVSRLRRRY